MNGFEGSFLGDAGRIDAQTRMECGVCWWVYEPSQGDAVWQVAPGTAFTDLPDHWRCPHCDAAPAQFMVLAAVRDDERGAQPRPERAAGLDTLARHQRELAQAYRAADEKMRALPVYNDKLDIQVMDLRRCHHGYVGVVATPWCMNLVLLPADDSRRREGTTRDLDFPSGRYTFTAGHLPGVGSIETCSLFSPMEAFEDTEAVRTVAEHAISELFRAEPAEPDATSTAGISRRQFLRPGALA